MTSLADAIIHGTTGEVKRLSELNEHVNFIDEYGYTPLIEACIMDNIDKAKVILARKPDLNFPDLIGYTSLHWAVDNHNIALCQLLLAEGANPNAYSLAGMPILTKPILRDQKELKTLLVSKGAKLQCAFDFVHAKLLGHRFALKGFVDILNVNDAFVEISLEGFILEFSLDALRKSLLDFRYNFSARQWEREFVKLRVVMGAFSRACTLVRLQHYNINHTLHMDKITPIIEEDPLIIPVAQEGHALALVRAGNLLAICDRAAHPEDDPQADKVKIYYMASPWRLTPEFVGQLIYVRQEMRVFREGLHSSLGLQEIASMPLQAQIAGNCSWANIEACIPALFYMLSMNDPEKSGERLLKEKAEAITFFEDWVLWDQDRALDYFVHEFSEAGKRRRATIAEILCAVLFEACMADNPADRARIAKIVPILRHKEVRYIAESYLSAYWRHQKTEAGENFKRMMQLGSDAFDV